MSRHMVITFGAIILLATVISACTSSPAAITLTLAAALPAGPSEAGVFSAQPETPSTIEGARALADQFGMAGRIYAAPSNFPNASGFLVVDGNRRLVILSNSVFTYYPQTFNYWLATAANASPADAETQIADFMRAYGFEQDYTVVFSEIHSAYYALPLSPDGFSLRHDFFFASGFLFSFDQSGIVEVSANLVSYEPVETFGIISAEEALQKALDPNTVYGTLEGFVSPSGSPGAWVRSYPLDQTLTLYGYLSSTPSLEGLEPLVTLDGYTVTGQVEDIADTLQETFVEAAGLFQTQGDALVFVLESWQVYDGYGEGLIGTLQQQGDQVILLTDDQRELLMPDVPADVPLPLENVYAMGVTLGGSFDWRAFDLRMADGGGGGGGGSGLGFYKINLTGTPVPLPTQEATQSAIAEEEVDPQLPSATIESVELVYFLPDPRRATEASNEPAYIQPMWRFTGRWSTGEVFEILVQALQAEFLLPEIQAIVSPG